MTPIDTSSLSPPAQKALSDKAPPPLRMMAAKGVMPGVKAHDIVTVLVVLAQAGGDLADTASKTLKSMPEPVLKGALQGDLQPAVIDALARSRMDEPQVIEQLLRKPAIAMDTVEHLARKGSERITEMVATNEERLLRHPRAIELLYLNKNTRMSTADRLIELAVRNGIELRGIGAWKEAQIAIQGELIPEATDEPLPEDEFFKETTQLAEKLTDDDPEEDAYVEHDDGAESLKDPFVPLFRRIAQMSTSQKIRRAILGTKEERMMLVRDSNRVVAESAVRSPQLKEPEVALISRNRSISEGVLRIIGSTPEWLKSYQIKKNLVENAKTPIAISQRLITQLREADLRKLAKSKSISAAVQQAARRHLSRRKR